MAKQLALRFEQEWRAKVSVSLSEEEKHQVVAALQEMLVAALEMAREGGITDGEGGD